MTALMKMFLAMLVLAAVPLPANSATFSAKRGLNLDLWVTWPDESRWNDEAVLLPFPEWRKHMSVEDLRALRDTGFDFLRMPVDPSPFLSEQAKPLRSRLFEEVLASARMVNEAGLKVIVDMHLIPAGANRSIGADEVMNDPLLFDRYVEMVRQMARTLSREDPEMIALEPMNEPVIDCEDGSNAWPERQKRLFAAARASAPRLTLMLTGACWSSPEGLAQVDPADYPDDNLMWDFHSYAPFLLTHQGALWAGDFIGYVTGLPYPPHAVPRAEFEAALEAVRTRISAEASIIRRPGMLAYLDELVAELDTKEELEAVLDRPFDIVAGWARKHDIAPENILLGEFGMIRQEYGTDHIVPADHRAAFVRDMATRAEEYGFAWSIWGYGGAFGVVEEFEGRLAEPDVLEMVRRLPAR